MTRHVITCAALLLGAVTLPVGAPVARAQDRPAQGAAERDARIAQLVRQLGDPSFEAREAAQRELIAIGAPALRALEAATKSEDPEVASRATEAVARIRQGRTAERSGPSGPQVEERRPDPRRAPEMPPLPSVGDIFKELEDQLPPEFGELFKDLFRGRLPGQDERDGVEERRPGQPRVRVWTFPQQEDRPTPGTPFDRALGAQVGPAGAALRAQLDLPDGEGLVVNQLDPEGRAAKAGIQLYDVIVGVDGRSVRTPRDLQPLLRAGAKVELYRKAQLQKLDVPAPQAAPAPPATPAPPQRAPSSGERSF
ncbi:MAG: PDZ domain-containing protein [Planctomycetes bacterium]|nr:PDZ domain-containing protein [Planctomycetota bacterium]